MQKITFKRGGHMWEHSTEEEKGYIPHFNGLSLPYIVMKCDSLGDWSVWSKNGEGEHVCGGLTYAEAKDSFTRYYLNIILN